MSKKQLCNSIGCINVDPHYHTSKGIEYSRMELIEVMVERDRLAKEIEDRGFEFQKVTQSLLAENDRYRKVLEEVAKHPYPDSDLKSLLETLGCRAKAALKGEESESA